VSTLVAAILFYDAIEIVIIIIIINYIDSLIANQHLTVLQVDA